MQSLGPPSGRLQCKLKPMAIVLGHLAGATMHIDAGYCLCEACGFLREADA